MARGLDAGKYFWRSGREKCFSLDIPFYRTSGCADQDEAAGAFAKRQDFLPLQAKPALCALNLGFGTGATAVRLARLGIHVTLRDSPPLMLDIAQRAAWDVGVTDEVVPKR